MNELDFDILTAGRACTVWKIRQSAAALSERKQAYTISGFATRSFAQCSPKRD